MASQGDTRAESSAPGAGVARPVLNELEQELQLAVEEIARGDYITVSNEEVEQWAETGVPPWPDDFPG